MALFFINRPIFAWVVSFLIMLAGILSLRMLPIAQYPDIAPPVINLTTTYPGASAKAIEEAVTAVLEREMNGAPGLLYMSASSNSNGTMEMALTFKQGTNPDLAAEVTLQPIRRYGFDAAILFADILLLPQALGPKLWFETGEGPRMETTTTMDQVRALKPTAAIHDTLSPVYETVRILARELPRETTLIGFAGAPWTVATYMIAGRGSKDQGAAHALKNTDRATFTALIDRITEATVEYLSAQVDAGAEVVKLFDSWAGSLKGQDFEDFAVKPAAAIISLACAGLSLNICPCCVRLKVSFFQGFADAAPLPPVGL